MNFLRKIGPAIFIFAFAVCVAGQTQPVASSGKTPVIVIPGITGSTLFDKRTDEQVWFKLRRPKGEDIRLPISPNLSANRDNLVAKDIIRGVKLLRLLPEIEIYEGLIAALQNGGYREADWDAPGEDGYQDTFYVFPYDWRLDNVENARLLIRKIEALKAKLKKPDLKFNVAAHSMGGLVTRYAAMYGNADIPNGRIVPTWDGARHLNEVFLFGTPNEGSILALRTAIEGYSLTGNIKVPFIQSFDKFDAFTIPSMPQILPWNESLTIYDENFKKIDIDLYDPKTWEKYNWAPWGDKKFSSKFDEKERRDAVAYFTASLNRAKRFHEALGASGAGKVPVSFYLIGGDCKDTPDSALLVFNAKKQRWETYFGGKGFTRSDGTKVSANEVRTRLNGKGDGTVAVRSLLMSGLTEQDRNKFLPITGTLLQCADHTKLITSPKVRAELLNLIR